MAEPTEEHRYKVLVEKTHAELKAIRESVADVPEIAARPSAATNFVRFVVFE